MDRQRLHRLLGTPELDWLVDRVRRRLAREETLDTTVTLADSTPAQRDAAHRLLGRPPRPGSRLSVSLSAVDEVLRRSGASPDGLVAAVVALRGPVTVRSLAAAEEERRWRAAFAPLEPLVEARPELAEWRERLPALVRRLVGTAEHAGPLLLDLAEVISALPAEGEALGRFAARVTGRAHALDDDRPLATLAVGAAQALGGLPVGTGAQWRREVWASVGVLRDELSTTVLALGLPGDTATATGRALGAWREAGQPVALTLRQLVRDPPRVALPGATVSVCENPVVLSSAADDLGAVCAPLVCTSGQPSVAVTRLLGLLADGGAALRYHGDFDWGGLRIANVLFGRFPARPWRYDAAAYIAAVDSGLGHRLSGTPAEATWDSELGVAMRQAGRAVEEELVLDELLTDLAGVTGT